MSVFAQLRRLRCVPRVLLAAVVLVAAQTAWLPCAMAHSDHQNAHQSAHQSTMPSHCVYCPPAHCAHDGHRANTEATCAFPHDTQAPAAAVGAQISLQYLAAIFVAPPLSIAFPAAHAEDIARQWAAYEHAIPIPHRPIHLTRCVQLK